MVSARQLAPLATAVGADTFDSRWVTMPPMLLPPPGSSSWPQQKAASLCRALVAHTPRLVGETLERPLQPCSTTGVPPLATPSVLPVSPAMAGAADAAAASAAAAAAVGLLLLPKAASASRAATASRMEPFLGLLWWDIMLGKLAL